MKNRAFRMPLAATLVAALAATAAALVPAPAYAAPIFPGLQYLVAVSESSSSVYKSIDVYCPAGQRVVGGSYDLEGAAGSVVLDDFIPTTDHLTVGAGEVVGPGEPADGTTADWQIKAIVACATPPPGLEIVVSTSAFGPGTSRPVQANCPSGKILISAGVSLSNGWGQISVNNMVMTATGTSALGVDDEDGYSGSWSISSYAVCASIPSAKVQIIGAESLRAPGDPGYQIAVFVRCPSGTTALGVGWQLSSTEELINTQAVIGDATNTDQSLVHTTGAVDADGRSGSWTVKVQADCVAFNT